MGYKGNKNRYFNSVEYNLVRVLNRMAKIIEEDGGKVYRKNEALSIHTRGYDEKIDRKKNMLESLAFSYSNEQTSDEVRESRVNVYANLAEELTVLKEQKEKAPVIKTRFVTLVSDIWVRFTLGGYSYYVDFDENPLFPDTLCKKPEGSDGEYYMVEIRSDEKTYYPDDMYSPVAKRTTIDKSAKELLALLKKHKPCDRYA